MPSLTVREYNSDSGALLGNISVLSFGRVTAGTHSRVKVIDIAFTDVSEVGNIKLGLLSSGGLIVNASPLNVETDGSASNGHFGIEDTSTFDSTKASAPLSRHFSGVNTDATAGNAKNVSISNRSETISNYIYLDIEIGSSSISAGNGSYKVFFDYS